MKKTASMILVLVLAVTAVMAVPAYRGVITRTLPDGSSIQLLLHGDEYFSYITTADGYLVKQMEDGYYQYATVENGRIMSLGVRAVDKATRTTEVSEMLLQRGSIGIAPDEISRCRKASSMQKRPASGQQRIVRGTADAAYTRNLVILVNFSDHSFTRTQTEFWNQFNQQGYSEDGATGSVKDYFTDNSYGQYAPVFDVYGPVTLDHDMAYYGAPSDDDNDVRPAQMTLDAVRKLSQSTTATINWSDYDCNSDGVIDNVIIYYAGYGENMGADENCIWPHQWYVGSYNTDITSDADRTFGGKLLSKYICMNELYGTYGSRMCGIGTFCHEFSHALGLMDLYVTDYSSSHKTVGEWDLMCSGSYNNDEHTPAGYSSFERFYVGWSTPTLLNEPATISTASTMAVNQSYVITATGEFNFDPEDPQPDEYYILENRQNLNWDSDIPGHGLLVEKIKWDAYSWYYNVGNNDPDNMVVDIIEAGNSTYEPGSASDPFPGTNNVTNFTPYSVYPLTDISEASQIITFDFMGGDLGPFTVYFNAGRGGVADTTSLSQTENGDTITLPDVTTDGSMEFVGWSTQFEAQSVDAGEAGDGFVPTADIVLHAVYAVGGEILPSAFEGCFAEKFSNLNHVFGEDITKTINKYADHKGWKGTLLTNNYGVVQVGSDDIKGVMTTPATGYQGDFEIAVTITQSSSGYLGIVTEDSLASSYVFVPGGMYVAYFHLSDVTPDSKLFISSDLQSFSISEVHICGEEMPAGIENQQQGEAVLIREEMISGIARVENVEPGSVIRVIDALGRVLSEEKAGGETYCFQAPHCFYIVEITKGNRREVLK